MLFDKGIKNIKIRYRNGISTHPYIHVEYYHNSFGCKQIKDFKYEDLYNGVVRDWIIDLWNQEEFFIDPASIYLDYDLEFRDIYYGSIEPIY